jgi:D-sedoheptulose 7-phosphate isomerase
MAYFRKGNMEKIKQIIDESVKLKRELINQTENIEKAADIIVESIKKGNKILIFGNGGSAADAQHIAAEIVGRYQKDRKGWPAIALTTDTSIITAISNDYGYDLVFSRQVEALSKKGDVLIGLSTSGNSKNIINALTKGHDIGTMNITFTGRDGGKIKEISDLNLNITSNNTARIQECHMVIYHIICELVEERLTK